MNVDKQHNNNFGKTRTQGVCFRDIIYEAHSCKKEYNVKDNLKNLSLKELKEIQLNDSYEIYSLFLNLNGDLNISSMVRTSALSGVKKVMIFGRRKYDRRGLVGADKYIDIDIINGFLGETIDYDVSLLKLIIDKNNFVPIYAEHGGTVIGSFSWKNKINEIYVANKKPLIIMGNESRGIPEYLTNFFDSYDHSIRVTIPQKGVLRSFNVGHAYSMILWDIRKDMGWL